MKPFFASDTTAAFLSMVVILYYIGLIVGTIPGITAFGFYCTVKNRPPWRVFGMILGGISIAAGIAALTFTAFFTTDAELKWWAASSVPLLVGLIALAAWVSQKRTITSN